MNEPMFRTVSLAPRGGPGLACDDKGLTLGAVALAKKVRDPAAGRRNQLISSEDMIAALRLAYGPVPDTFVDRRCAGVVRVTQLLGMGEDGLARIYAVLLDFPEIGPGGMAKLTTVSLGKSSEDDWEDEPRVPAGNSGGGRWTSNGDGGAAPETASSDTAAPGAAIAGAIGAESLFGEIGLAAITGLEALGAGFAATTAFLGVIFIPTNSGVSTTGTLSGRPDIDYRLDEDTGNLQLYRNGEVLFDGQHGPDGLFHAADGSIFGRQVEGSIVLDPGTLPGYASQVQSEQAGTVTQSTAATSADSSQPKLCPDPTPDQPRYKSERALAYQEQITGLPRGLAVEVNGVTFDGCRESDGTMLEAKGNYEWALQDPDHLYSWFTGDPTHNESSGKAIRSRCGRRAPNRMALRTRPGGRLLPHAILREGLDQHHDHPYT